MQSYVPFWHWSRASVCIGEKVVPVIFHGAVSFDVLLGDCKLRCSAWDQQGLYKGCCTPQKLLEAQKWEVKVAGPKELEKPFKSFLHPHQYQHTGRKQIIPALTFLKNLIGYSNDITGCQVEFCSFSCYHIDCAF